MYNAVKIFLLITSRGNYGGKGQRIYATVSIENKGIIKAVCPI